MLHLPAMLAELGRHGGGYVLYKNSPVLWSDAAPLGGKSVSMPNRQFWFHGRLWRPLGSDRTTRINWSFYVFILFICFRSGRSC